MLVTADAASTVSRNFFEPRVALVAALSKSIEPSALFPPSHVTPSNPPLRTSTNNINNHSRLQMIIV
jgi:hypothetical protein